MNQTEKKAYMWLQEVKGYSHDEIIYQYCRSPDFICADGKTFEIKKITNNKIIFHNSQFENLKNMTDLTVIVYDEKQKCSLPLFIIPFDEITGKQQLGCGCSIYLTPLMQKHSVNYYDAEKQIDSTIDLSAKIDSRNRAQINATNADLLKLQEGDIIIFNILRIIRKGEQP